MCGCRERTAKDTLNERLRFPNDSALFEYRHIELSDTTHFWQTEVAENKIRVDPAAQWAAFP